MLCYHKKRPKVSNTQTVHTHKKIIHTCRANLDPETYSNTVHADKTAHTCSASLDPKTYTKTVHADKVAHTCGATLDPLPLDPCCLHRGQEACTHRRCNARPQTLNLTCLCRQTILHVQTVQLHTLNPDCVRTCTQARLRMQPVQS